MGNALRTTSREKEIINNDYQLTDDEDELAYSPKSNQRSNDGYGNNQLPAENIQSTVNKNHVGLSFDFSRRTQETACGVDQIMQNTEHDTNTDSTLEKWGAINNENESGVFSATSVSSETSDKQPIQTNDTESTMEYDWSDLDSGGLKATSTPLKLENEIQAILMDQANNNSAKESSTVDATIAANTRFVDTQLKTQIPEPVDEEQNVFDSSLILKAVENFCEFNWSDFEIPYEWIVQVNKARGICVCCLCKAKERLGASCGLSERHCLLKADEDHSLTCKGNGMQPKVLNRQQVTNEVHRVCSSCFELLSICSKTSKGDGFQCCFDSCTENIRTKGLLIKHLSKHLKHLVYVCPVCEEVFELKQTLLHHQRNIH